MSEAGPLWLHRAMVRPEWVDYNGHMSEAYYVLVFGDTTDAFYDFIGLDQRARQDRHVSVYTVEAHIRYLAEAREGTALRIGTRVVWHDAKRLRLRHEMFSGSSDKVLALTELLLLHVDKRSMSASAFLPHIAERIAEIAQSHAKLPPSGSILSRHWLGA